MTQLIVKPVTASNVKQLVQNALENELHILRVGIEKTRQKLRLLEQQFGMESQKFYQEFQSGKMGDRIEYITWAGEYETLLQLQQDYQELVETQLC
jgi:hypothetical protein